MRLTSEEQKIIELLREVWSLFSKLPEYHPQDSQMMDIFIVGAQNIILSRVATRPDEELEDS